MELKDVRSTKGLLFTLSNGPSSSKVLTASKSNLLFQDSTVISDKAQSKSTESTSIRSRTNELISVVNIAQESTREIEKLIKSIEGIVEQVQSKDLTPQKRSILEQEAKELVEAIKDKASVQTPSGIKPLAGDKVQLNAGQDFAKALEVTLPADAKDAFGLGQINFSSRDFILSTIANVKSAQVRVQQLKGAVEDSADKVRSTVSELEVAAANVEASQASLRDVDEAISLASNTNLTIHLNPKEALSSFGKLDVDSLELLK